MDFNDRKRVEKMLKSISSIYGDIDACIGNLVKSRLNKDTELEGKASAEMESLLVASQQEFGCVTDLLEDLLSKDKVKFVPGMGSVLDFLSNPQKVEHDDKTQAINEQAINEHMKQVEAEYRSRAAMSRMAVEDFHFTD